MKNLVKREKGFADVDRSEADVVFHTVTRDKAQQVYG
jgi:hypothetical protein